MTDRADADGFRVAVIGSGPSGFFATEALLGSGRPLAVDMFEQLPVPYGLVRAEVLSADPWTSRTWWMVIDPPLPISGTALE